MLQKLAEDLVFRAVIESSIYCRGNGEPYPGANSKPHRKPGRMIMLLSKKDREQVKKLKPNHFSRTWWE